MASHVCLIFHSRSWARASPVSWVWLASPVLTNWNQRLKRDKLQLCIVILTGACILGWFCSYWWKTVSTWICHVTKTKTTIIGLFIYECIFLLLFKFQTRVSWNTQHTGQGLNAGKIQMVRKVTATLVMGKTKKKKNKKNLQLKLIISPGIISQKATLQSVVESNSCFGTVNTKLHPNVVVVLSSWVLPLMVRLCRDKDRNTANNVNTNHPMHSGV